MSGQQESTPIGMFAIVLGALVIFTLFIGVMANAYSPSSDPMNDPIVAEQQKQRLMPVGKSRIAQ